MWGRFTMHCAVCGVAVEVVAGGIPMWGGPRAVGKTCGKDCFDELALRDARSILGKDTPPEGTEAWQARLVKTDSEEKS